MELMELAEYFAFGIAVKDAKEEIEKYRDILVLKGIKEFTNKWGCRSTM